MILEREENKGVELTGGRRRKLESRNEEYEGRLVVDSPDLVGIFDLRLKVKSPNAQDSNR
jgi:hypothetical protein